MPSNLAFSAPPTMDPGNLKSNVEQEAPKVLPTNIIADLSGLKSWISRIASPAEFHRAYNALANGHRASAIDRWLDVCETLSLASMHKAYRARTNRLLAREDLMQHGRIAAFRIASQVIDGELTIVGHPMHYASRSIKREIQLAAFGKTRPCGCRAEGKCTFQCNCREEFDINCDCSCGCKCHKRTVSNFSDYYGDGDFDPIDRLADEGAALRERVEDILHYCKNQPERDVVVGIADAIEDGIRPNAIYLTLDYTQAQILGAWKAVAAHYKKVFVSSGEPLPGKPGGNQRRPPKQAA